MDAAPQVGDKRQCPFPPQDEDSAHKNPILHNLNDLLRSLHPPSPADIQHIHLYLERHRHPSTHVECCRSLLAPIRRLPNETLDNVFAMTCLSEHGCHSLRIHDTPPYEGLPYIAPTLTLTHVSYRWRLLVNASTRLWSSISLAIGPLTIPRGRTNIRSLLSLYLSQSKEHPLDLQFWQSISNDTLIIDMVFPHISRIKFLDLSTEPDSAPFIPARVWDAFRTGAPKLSAVKMVHPLRNPSRFPCHQLKVLEIQQVHDSKALISLIPLCTQLHTLKLGTCPESSRTLDEDIRITMRSLRCLSVIVNDDNQLSFISQQIGFPSLVSLELKLYRTRFFAPLVDIASGRCLKKVVLKFYHVLQTSSNELYEFLESCPELSELRVDYWSSQKHNNILAYKFVEALSCQAPVVAPHLTALRIYEPLSFIESETVNVFLNMLEKRVSALNDKTPTVGQSKWDFEFGRLFKCTEEDYRAFSARLESLGRRGLICRIQGAGNVVK